MSKSLCIYADGPTNPATAYGIGEAWNLNDNPENDSNARLIAAAPDLYEALKGLVEWYGKRTGVLGDDRLLPPDEQEPEIQKALAALTKAEGR